MKITKDTRISKILEEKPKAVKILIEVGMQCIGCPMMSKETLEQGCLVHGMAKKEIDLLVKKLNQIK